MFERDTAGDNTYSLIYIDKAYSHVYRRQYLLTRLQETRPTHTSTGDKIYSHVYRRQTYSHVSRRDDLLTHL